MATKQKKYHFIYKTINILTGRYYYGMHSTNDLEDEYLGSGKRLGYSVRKYGKENHKREILEFCKNRKELKKREEEIVNLNEVAKKDCMNLMVGGNGGDGRGGYSQRNFGGMEGRKRGIIKQKYLRETNSKWVENKSRKVSNANKESYENGTRQRICFYDWTGKTHREKSKKLIGLKNSIHQKGEGNSQYGTCWIYNDKENKKINKEELSSYLEKGWIRGRKMK